LKTVLSRVKLKPIF